MRRRELLLGALGTIVYVACGSDDPKGEAGPTPDPRPGGDGGPSSAGDAGEPLAPTSKADDSHRVFPQGLASGDPRPDRVVLWTRVEPAEAGKAATDDVEIEWVVAKDEALTQIVGRGVVTAAAASDHTVRLVPTGLEPGRHYHYRFGIAGNGTTTQVGRTKTAPAPDADVAVRYAMCACQDYIGRYWHSWRALLEEKADLDFVLYLGDYIYESVNDARFQSTAPDREIKLPDGIDTSTAQDKSRIAANTLADYRTLYKAYRKDPLLREAHRLYPFIVTWDDHEFSDDCWQDHSTSFNEKDPVTGGFTDEKNTPRKSAANRAFFEFQPLDVEFKPNLGYPFDLKIYRQLRYGKHVELFVTDQRSYRSDHVVPEGPANLSVGKPIDNTIIGSRYFVRKAGFDTLEANVKPTLLGAQQKAWFVDAVKASNATWKVWCNEVQVYEMKLDLWRLPGVPDSLFGFQPYTVYVNADQWDGFRTERREILDAFSKANVSNLLVCTGDIHSFYAAELHVDFATPAGKPIGVEYVTAGISSASLKELMSKFVETSDSDGGSAIATGLKFVVDAWTGAANKTLIDSCGSYLKYADTDSYGFTLMSVDGTQAEATFVEIANPKDPTYSGVIGRKRFVTQIGTNRVTAL